MSEEGECTIRCLAQFAQPGTASLAEHSIWRKNHPNDRVRLEVDGIPNEFKVVVRPSADGEEVIVAPGAFGMAEGDTKSGRRAVSSAKAARWHWLWHTVDGRLTVAGLGLAIVAEGIKLAITLGPLWPLFSVGTTGVAILNVVATLLAAIGLVLVVWKGLFTEH